jgi:hypothetical protein
VSRGGLAAAVARTPAANQPESRPCPPGAIRRLGGRALTQITRDYRVVIPPKPASMSCREYLDIFNSDLMMIEFEHPRARVRSLVSGPEQAGVHLATALRRGEAVTGIGWVARDRETITWVVWP